MKALAVILSLYIFILATLPCVDRPIEKALHQSGLSCKDADNHEHESDHCSPFCVCNCCGNPVVSMESFLLSNVFQFSEKLVFWYTPIIESNPYHFIWQPPKLS